ncbi:MAG: TolC family protein, partial [Kiritimatiellaeota bacterium]|nr:TolC family protein [Kiritimatiellota bacterium]
MNKTILFSSFILPVSCLLAADPPRWTRQDCEAYALTNAPAILRQQLARQNASHNRSGAWDAYLPRLNADVSGHHASGGGSTSSASASLTGALPYGLDYAGRVSSTQNQDDSWSLEISKRLWGAGSWEGSRASLRNAALADESAELLLRRYTRELVETVRLRCHEIIRTRQTHISNNLRLDQARRNLEVALANDNPLDIANARYEVPQAEAQVLRSERLVTDALDRLKETLGLDITHGLDTEDALPETHPALDVEADLAWVVAQSEDVRIQMLHV